MKRASHIVAFFCVSFLLAVVVPTVLQAKGGDPNWAQWRGPDGQGVSSESNLPTEWSNTKNIQWKTAIPGRAYSSPIVWGKRIFLTNAIEGEVIPGAKAVPHYFDKEEFKHPDAVGADRQYTFQVLCLDADTGKLLWERVCYQGTVYDSRHRKGSYAASTPITDGQYVYAYFGSEGVYCFDFKGKPMWKASVGKIGTLGLGVSSCPVLYENLLIMQCDEDNGEKSFIVALNKKTGKEVWRTPRKVQVNWSSPVIAQTGGRAELLTSGTENIIAYDPTTGKELWRSKGLESYVVPTPLVGHGLAIFTIGSHIKRAVAIRLGGSGDVSESNIVWQYNKGTAYTPSPILYGDYVYLMTDRGIITCLEAKTGKVMYEGSRVPVPATFSASPVAFDGKILISSEDGDTFVLKAGPKFEIVHTNSLGEPLYASLAVAGGKLFIRGSQHLYCIRNESGK